MHVLGIESTCDETAIAVVKDGIEILSNVIASSAQMQSTFGGVFPEMASRQHEEIIIQTIETALKEANLSPSEIDLIAVAKGPGLIGPLVVGLAAAKSLAMGWGIPFVGVNHIEAHLYAAMMRDTPPIFPSLGVVVSGGHTFLAKIDGPRKYTLIGTTIDDAVGEAFDKVARILGLPYPGGPEIEKLAKRGDKERYSFNPGVIKDKPWHFSFSGLKTNVLYTAKGKNPSKHSPLILNDQEKADLAASFQETALKNIVEKAALAAEHFGCKAIYAGGGVTSSTRLRELFHASSPLPIFFPGKGLSLDNGAMIAGLGYHVFKAQGHGDAMDLEPQTRIPITSS